MEVSNFKLERETLIILSLYTILGNGRTVCNACKVAIRKRKSYRTTKNWKPNRMDTQDELNPQQSIGSCQQWFDLQIR